VTKPPSFAQAFAKVLNRMLRRRRIRWCVMLVWACYMAFFLGEVAGQLAGWNGVANIATLANTIAFLFWAAVFALASAEYYRAQPDADWADPGGRGRHVVWLVGRRLAKVIPPLKAG
jgi:hypothetical protein